MITSLHSSHVQSNSNISLSSQLCIDDLCFLLINHIRQTVYWTKPNLALMMASWNNWTYCRSNRINHFIWFTKLFRKWKSFSLCPCPGNSKEIVLYSDCENMILGNVKQNELKDLTSINAIMKANRFWWLNPSLSITNHISWDWNNTT